MKHETMFPSATSGNRITQAAAMLAFFAFIPMLLQAQCVSQQDYRSDKKRGVVVDHIVLNDTRAVSSAEMAEITANFTGSCFDEHNDEIGERIRDQFQQRGYFQAKVEHVSVKATDPLAMPKPVTVDADVLEGPMYRLSELEFGGNRAFTTEQLKAQFPLKLGDVLNTQRVRSGLSALRRLYGSEGYLDFIPVPETKMHSDPTAILKISIVEGKQYRMGKLEIVGRKEQTAPLQMRWSLEAGVPFDAGYLQRFLDDNKGLFPSGFQERDSVRVLRNCRDATVTIAIILEKSSTSQQFAKEIDCDKDASSPKS